MNLGGILIIMRLILGLIIGLIFFSQVVLAERIVSHPPLLSSAQLISVEVQMLTPQASVYTSRVEKIVENRMEEVGYRIETSKDGSPDVVIQVTCELGEDQEGTRRIDPSLSSHFTKPKRLTGPPCLFNYRDTEALIPWHEVDRVIFSQGLKTAKQLFGQYPDASSRLLLVQYLRAFEFPLFFSAEWRQVDRLLDIFHSSDTPLSRKKNDHASARGDSGTTIF